MLEIIKTTLLGAACLLGGVSFIFLIAYLVSNFMTSFFITIAISSLLMVCYETGRTLQK